MSLNALRLSLDGLQEQDAETLRRFVRPAPDNPAELWDIGAGGCQAMVVDPGADGATAALRDRPFGALIIWVLEPGEIAWPGTLTLMRPFEAPQVRLTLNIAAQIALQPEFRRQQQLPESRIDDASEHEDDVSEHEPVGSAPLGSGDSEFTLTSEPAVPVESPAASAAPEESGPDELEDADLLAAELLRDSNEPSSLSLFDAAIEATFQPEDAGAAHDVLQRGSHVLPQLAVVEDALELFAPEGQTDDGAVVLVSAAADAMASASDRLRELTLAEALAELTPTSVPPGQWTDELKLANAPLDDPEMPATESDAPPIVDAPVVASSESAALDEAGSSPEPVHAQGSEQEAAFAEPSAEAVAAESIASADGAEPAVEVDAPADPLAALETPHEGTVRTLAGLAAAYREQLYREREVLVQIEDLSFHLLPYQGVCVSDSDPARLARFRGRESLDIEIDLLVTEPGERVGLAASLVHFLWHLGLNAGNGTLLPWIPADRPCKLMRRPPLTDQDVDSPMFRLAALLSRAPQTVSEAMQAARATEIETHDFLNGVSLLGYLEVLAATPRTGRADAASARATAPRSLVGRLRKRIGLQQ
jgi:hypothetical protein